MKNFNENVKMMLELLEQKDQATCIHSIRVSEISKHLAREMGIRNPRKLRTIRIGTLLHDIGKVFIPDEILLAEGGLSSSEFDVMKLHPLIGKVIIAVLLGDPGIEDIVFQHQESFDGSGYPTHIKADEICIGAKICSVADAFDAILSGRAYCMKKNLKETLAEMERCSGAKFDPEVVDALKRCSKELDRLLSLRAHVKKVMSPS